jgi:hypothetical protein
MNLIRLPNPCSGIYISHVATLDGNYSFDYGANFDDLPWKNRGLCASLILVASELSKADCGTSLLYLQCNDDLPWTYGKLGFVTMNADDKAHFYSDAVVVDEVPGLCTMKLVGTPICSAAGTPAAVFTEDHNEPNRRPCCHSAAWCGLPNDFLFEYDKAIVEFFDLFHDKKTRNKFVGVCSLCGETAFFSHSNVTNQFYSFMQSHMSLSFCIGKSKALADSLNELEYKMLRSIQMKHDGVEAKLSNQYTWIFKYLQSVEKSSCIPGCCTVTFSDNESDEESRSESIRDDSTACSSRQLPNRSSKRDDSTACSSRQLPSRSSKRLLIEKAAQLKKHE